MRQKGLYNICYILNIRPRELARTLADYAWIPRGADSTTSLAWMLELDVVVSQQTMQRQTSQTAVSQIYGY
jgi:hypothetical protein